MTEFADAITEALADTYDPPQQFPHSVTVTELTELDDTTVQISAKTVNAADQLASWAETTQDLVVLHRDGTALTITPRDNCPRYITRRRPCAGGAAHYVHDRINRFDLRDASYFDGESAWAAARSLNTHPDSVLSAIRDHDTAVAGNPETAAAADVLRTIRRYGYAGAVRLSSLYVLHNMTEINDLIMGGDLAELWNPVGEPYITSPALGGTLCGVLRRWEGERFHVADFGVLEREFFRPRAVASCGMHGLTNSECPLCGPGQWWQCHWGDCRANAVNNVGPGLSTVPYCEVCAPEALASHCA